MRNKSFTLIELVIVMVVIAIASAGLAVSMNQVLKNIRVSEAMSTATALALSEAERVKALTFANIVDQNRGAPISYGGNFGAYSWQVRVDPIDTVQPNLGTDPTMANYKVVEVRVHNSAINYVSIIFLRTNH
jgi:prepilin-type N-terminal cleavage/methylation domain-containing protein